jgi:RNA-directed DNA polymerase
MPAVAESKDITNMSAPTLFDILCSEEHLLRSWQNLNRTNPESFGLSGERIVDFEANLPSNLENISQRLKAGTYRFSPSRPYLIRKDNGKFRPLQIPEVSDRLVLKALAIILERHLRNVLLPGEGISFAYQKGKGMQEALSKITEHYHNDDRFVYEADIVDFFGTVKRDRIIQQVCRELPDASLNALIVVGITPRIGGLSSIPAEQHHLFKDNGGIPQGNPLSPLFSNVYLSPFDKIMSEQGFHLVRYADDFVVLTKSWEHAKSAYEFSKNYLQDELGLEIHALSNDPKSKTRIVDPSRESFSFLSVTFDGKALFPSVKAKEKFIESIMELCSDSANPNIYTFLTKLKNKHDGWVSTFLFTDESRYFEEIDFIINWGVYKYFTTVGWSIQKKSLGKVPTKFRRSRSGFYESGLCLSLEQRKSCGIPLSKDLYALRRQKMEQKKSPAKQKPKPKKAA